jgi:hypothetical protein
VERGDELAHVMRWDDTDAQYGGSFYVDWMKGSPQGTSLRGDVILPSYPRTQYFNDLDGGSGGVVHIDDATGDTKGRML